MAYSWKSGVSASVRGTPTLAANLFTQAGKSIRITARGWIISTGSAREFTPKLYLGTTEIWNGGARTLDLSEEGPYTLDAIVTCYSTGSSGTVRTAARLLVNLSSTGFQWWEDGTEPANVTIDTTASQTIDWGFYFDFNSCTFTCTHFLWEALD